MKFTNYTRACATHRHRQVGQSHAGCHGGGDVATMCVTGGQ